MLLGRNYLRVLLVGTLFPLGVSLTSCGGGGGGGSGGSSEDADRTLQGGETTFSDRSSLAFEHPSANLDGEEDRRHAAGDADFGAIFVTPPATLNAGLGPTFNNNSCNSCHTKNGRGQPVFGTGFQGSRATILIRSTERLGAARRLRRTVGARSG